MAFGDNMKEMEDPSVKQDFTNYQSSIHEERIKNAPKIVRDYYNGTGIKFEKGLFRVLVANKTNRMIFVVMIFMLLIVFIKGQFGNTPNLKVVNGYECELHSFSYDSKIYANIKIHPVSKTRRELKKEEEKTVEEFGNENTGKKIHIEMYSIDKDDIQIKFDESDYNTALLGESNIFRFSSDDYDIKKVCAIVEIGGEKEELSVAVEVKEQ